MFDKEADKWLENNLHSTEEDYKEAYLAGAKSREKRIAELEAQIEKMKCCENCNNFMHRIDHRCNTKCKNLSEWEIKENA